ncbi:MAG: OmpA family protein [Bacteroidales bacterium]
MIDRDDFKTGNLTLSMQNREIATKIAALEAEIASSRQDIALAEIERNKAREDMNTLSDRFNALQIAQDDLIKGNLTDNWDLSVKRATTVVRTLLEGTRIDPARLTASGRSEYMPVDPANTAEARQKNRRTEIVLTPDLTELYSLINQL